MNIMNDFQIDTPYIPKEKGCRLIWRHNDDEKVIYLRHEDLAELNDVLSHNSTSKMELEDGVSSIMVNSDITEFFMAHMKPLEIQTKTLKDKINEFLTKNPDA
jgi:hypothetical protein